MYAAGFAWVWYESYSSAILLPFYRRGNWVMILIYVVLVLLFAKSFGGLKIGYLKRTDMFYSQTLSIFCVNVVTYFQISVVNRDFSATVPMVLLTIVDLAVLILWIVLTNKLYFRLYPPRKLVVIYGDRNAAGGAENEPPGGQVYDLRIRQRICAAGGDPGGDLPV